MIQRLALSSLLLLALSVGLIWSAPVNTTQAALQAILNAEECSDNILDCLGGPVSVGVVRECWSGVRVVCEWWSEGEGRGDDWGWCESTGVSVSYSGWGVKWNRLEMNIQQCSIWMSGRVKLERASGWTVFTSRPILSAIPETDFLCLFRDIVPPQVNAPHSPVTQALFVGHWCMYQSLCYGTLPIVITTTR